MDISNLARNTQAVLVSDPFSASGGACLTFYYYMYGQHVGMLSVRVTGSSSNIWSLQSEQRMWSLCFTRDNLVYYLCV